MGQVRASILAVLISTIIFWERSYSICVKDCKCYENSKLVTCSNIQSFPKVPIRGLFHYLVIYKSNLFDYTNLKLWTTLKKISLVQTDYNCAFLKELSHHNIEFEIDNNVCRSTEKTISSTLSYSKIGTTIFMSSSVSKISQIFSEMITTTPIQSDTTSSPVFSAQNHKKTFPLIKLIIGISVSLIILIISIFTIIYCVKKKVKVSRLPPNLPSGSQLDMPNPSVAIEMDSFDSFDFHSSSENIYEVPNPIYSNV
jgi:hypothetical protein